MRCEPLNIYWIRRVYNGLILKPQIFYRRIKNWLGYRLCLFLKGWAPSPSGIFIAITNKCNLSCKMCDYSLNSPESLIFSMLSSEKELPKETWKKLIDEVAAFRPGIFFVAAEPLLYEGIEELIRYVKKEKGLPCSLATNGFLLKEFAKRLVDFQLDYLEVSFDGPPHIHDKIRGKAGSFDRLVQGIKEVQCIRGGGSKPRINVTYAISDYNFSEIVETMDILDSLNEDWDSVSFCHLSYLPEYIVDSHNREHPDFIMGPRSVWRVNPLNVDAQKLKSQIEQIKKRRYRVVRFVPDLCDEDLELWYSDPLRIKKDARRCTFPWINANIAPGGKIVPLVGCGDIVFGDIKNESFKKIWNNQKIRSFRIRMRKAGRFPACFGCCSLK